jgi:hypothetical protein
MNDPFEILERELIRAAVRAHTGSPAWQLRWPRRGPRGRVLALFAVLCLAGATGALAAAGVFQTGTAVKTNVPATPRSGLGVVANLASVQLLALSVSDPQGGPPWGLRLVRTTRGLVCLQLGRLDHGTIGVLGIDGEYANDGRFHPLPINYEQGGSPPCATVDAAGNTFVASTWHAVPASGLYGGCHGVAASLFAEVPAGPQFRAAAQRARASYEHAPGPVCPPSDLRNIYYGLLGPDAVSISYPGASGRLVSEKTAGSQGAYLVLGPPTEFDCQLYGSPGALKPVGCTNGAQGSERSLAAGFIRSVTYRNGHVCHLPPPKAGYIPDASCPPIGNVGPRTGRITSQQVATPLSVQIGKVTPDCGPNGKSCGWPLLNVTISFTARVAVPNAASHYEYNLQFTPDGPCSHGHNDGLGGSTLSDLRAGQRVHLNIGISSCPGIVHGAIVYNGPNARNSEFVPGVGYIEGPLVGTFSFHMQ